MNLVTKKHRVLAVLVGIALLVAVVMQIWRDGRNLRMKAETNIQSITK